jgi:hypothetical protein
MFFFILFNPSTWTTQKAQLFYCCVNSSRGKVFNQLFHSNGCVITLVVTVTLILLARITWQRLFLLLQSSCFEQIRQNNVHRIWYKYYKVTPSHVCILILYNQKKKCRSPEFSMWKRCQRYFL